MTKGELSVTAQSDANGRSGDRKPCPGQWSAILSIPPRHPTHLPFRAPLSAILSAFFCHSERSEEPPARYTATPHPSYPDPSTSLRVTGRGLRVTRTGVRVTGNRAPRHPHSNPSPFYLRVRAHASPREGTHTVPHMRPYPTTPSRPTPATSASMPP